MPPQDLRVLSRCPDVLLMDVLVLLVVSTIIIIDWGTGADIPCWYVRASAQQTHI